MLIELAILLSSCSASGASLGICKSECPTARGAAYTICAERQTSRTKPVSKPPAPKPMRLCSYFVNGTIDVPTASVITAWVEVGSRLCIGDPPPPEPKPRARTIAEEVTDQFTAYATAPFAYLSPSGEVEVGEPVSFGVNTGGGTHGGLLFGSAAEIRFAATSVTWSFSDGQIRSGRFVSISFANPQQITARASVEYRVDYRYLGSGWVLGAANVSLDSNQLNLNVIDPPRRSLLRD
jgi:hypothetical protein